MARQHAGISDTRGAMICQAQVDNPGVSNDRDLVYIIFRVPDPVAQCLPGGRNTGLP